MGLLTSRAADEQPKVKQFRQAVRRSNMSMDQLAYGTWRAMAADDPRKAAAATEQIAALSLSSSDKAAVDAVLSGIGVS